MTVVLMTDREIPEAA